MGLLGRSRDIVSTVVNPEQAEPSLLIPVLLNSVPHVLFLVLIAHICTMSGRPRLLEGSTSYASLGRLIYTESQVGHAKHRIKCSSTSFWRQRSEGHGGGVVRTDGLSFTPSNK